MSTPASSNARSNHDLRQVLARHNENKINLLNGHERFVAGSMLNFPPPAYAMHRLHTDGVTDNNPCPTNTDLMTLEGNTNPGQQLFEQLTQNKRRRDRLLVPDLATEWFRKQKIFLDKISPEELHACQTPKPTLPEQLLPNSKKSACMTQRQELSKRKLCHQQLQSKCICCKRVARNRLEPLSKRSIKRLETKAEQDQTAREQKEQTQDMKNRDQDPISICNPQEKGNEGYSKALLPTDKLDNISMSRKKNQISGVSCLKLPLRRRCACRQTSRQRHTYSCIFQADGQPMSGDCLAARRTEPLLPRLRKKYDLRKVPQRRLDPTHFRRISPEFYSLLKSYEDGMNQRYPLYGVTMRYWSETKPNCACGKRVKAEDQCLGDEAVNSLPKKLNTPPNTALMKDSTKTNGNPTEGDGGDSGSKQAITATLESSTIVPCTNNTCAALKSPPAIHIKCQYCNTCYLYPMKKDKDKPSSKKSNSGICSCFRPQQPQENEKNRKDTKKNKITAYTATTSTAPRGPAFLGTFCDISRRDANPAQTGGTGLTPTCNLPPYRSFSTTHEIFDSPTSAFQAPKSTEMSSLPTTPDKQSNLLGDLACLCKRALLPGRHLLYNFNNKYRQYREEYSDRYTGKAMPTKRHSKQMDMHNEPPNLFETHPAPCCWHLRDKSDVCNSKTSLKANYSMQNIENCDHRIADFRSQGELDCIYYRSPKYLCSCVKINEGPENVATQDATTESRAGIKDICEQSFSHLAQQVSEELGPQAPHPEALLNLAEESSVIVKHSKPTVPNSKTDPINRCVYSSNEKCIQSNAQGLGKKNTFKCECSSLSDNNPKAKKKKHKQNTEGTCNFRKFSCPRACFLASDYLQLMRRVARKRASRLPPKHKSIRSKGSRGASPFQTAKHMVACPLSNSKSNIQRNYKLSVCHSPDCSGLQGQNKAKTDLIHPRHQPKQHSCEASSYSQNKETSNNRWAKLHNLSMYQQNVSSHSYLDTSSTHNSQQSFIQDANHLFFNLKSESVKSQWCSSCWKDETRSSNSDRLIGIQSQDIEDLTSSDNQNGALRLCCCERMSTPSQREPCPSQNRRKIKKKEDHHCSSSSSSSYSRNSCSGYNITRVFPPGPEKNDEEAKMAYEPKTRPMWSNHAQHVKTSQPNCSYKTFAKRQPKMDDSCANSNKRQMNGINTMPFHEDLLVPKSNENYGCSKERSYMIEKPLVEDLGFRCFHQSIPSALNSQSQLCNWEERQNINIHSKTSTGQKRARFSVGLQRSRSFKSLNSSCIVWPCAPEPPIVNVLSDTLDMCHKLGPISKNHFKSMDSMQYTNECCNPVKSFYKNVELTSEQEQKPFTETSLHRSQNCTSRSKYFSHRPAVNEEFIRQRMSLEKRPKHHYNHNHAQLLLYTRRPPPPQSKNSSNYYRLQQTCGFKKKHFWPSSYQHFDDQHKKSENTDAYETEKQCFNNAGKMEAYKYPSITQRTNSGFKAPAQKEARNQQCGCRDSSRIGTPIKHGNRLRFNYNPSPKQLGRTNARNLHNQFNEDPFKSSLLSQYAIQTTKNNGTLSPGLSRRRCINRNYLRPASVVSDLDFYTHPASNPPLMVSGNPTDIYTKPPTPLGIFLDNLRSRNISNLLPSSTSVKTPQKDTSSTCFFQSQQSLNNRHNYLSSSDIEDESNRAFQRLG